jgi:alkylated DNA repair dioxygenase AlkB
MLLFDEKINNLMPFDGTVTYYPGVLTQAEAYDFFDRLLNTIEWKNDETVIMGRRIVTKRMVAWYGDSPFSYTYSGTTKEALEWTAELLELRTLAEEITGAKFNSCLLNLYHNGDEGLGWHSDNEDTLVPNATIASFSLGAARQFSFRHRKSKHTISLTLANGSLLAMKGPTQSHWVHSLPKSVKVTEPRINLTFRTMRGEEYGG